MSSAAAVRMVIAATAKVKVSSPMEMAKAEKKMTAARVKQQATAAIAKAQKIFHQNAEPAELQDLPLTPKQPVQNQRKFSVYL